MTTCTLITRDRCIEVRALEQKMLVQTIRMSDQIKDSIKFITHSTVTLVASHTQVLCRNTPWLGAGLCHTH